MGGLIGRLLLWGGAAFGLVKAGGAVEAAVNGGNSIAADAAGNVGNAANNPAAWTGVDGFMTGVARFFEDLMKLLTHLPEIMRGEYDPNTLFSGSGTERNERGLNPPSNIIESGMDVLAPGAREAFDRGDTGEGIQHAASGTAAVAVGVGVGAAVGGWAAGGAIGAAIGSFIPVPGVGTAAGWLVGAAVGWVAGEVARGGVEMVGDAIRGDNNGSDRADVPARVTQTASLDNDSTADSSFRLASYSAPDMGSEFTASVGEGYTGGPTTSQSYSGAFLRATSATPGSSSRRPPRQDGPQAVLA